MATHCDGCTESFAGTAAYCTRCGLAVFCSRQCAQLAWDAPDSLHRWLCARVAANGDTSRKRPHGGEDGDGRKRMRRGTAGGPRKHARHAPGEPESEPEEHWLAYQHRAKRRRTGADPESDEWRALPPDVQRWQLGGLPVAEFARLYQQYPTVQRVVDIERDAFVWHSRQLFAPLREYLRERGLGLRALFGDWARPRAWPAREGWLQGYALLATLQPSPEHGGYVAPATLAFLEASGARALLAVLEALGARAPPPPSGDTMDVSAHFATLRLVMGIYDRRYDERDVFPFWSNAAAREHYVLSNFFRAPFTWRADQVSDVTARVFPNLRTWLGRDGRVFQSSEHAWQALKATTLGTFLKFTASGEFGDLRGDFFVRLAPFLGRPKRRKNEDDAAFAARTTPEAVAAAKVAAWSKKNMVGVVAKMAANPKYYRALGIEDTMRYVVETGLTSDVERAVWLDLLRQKYTQNPGLKQALLNTGDDYLLEFVRGAEREARAGRRSHWGGLIDDAGTLWGENTMGGYLMRLRDEFVAVTTQD
jgi:predicted NAD-dependent protein-ADP-ribosyltransferase YbiA (DUF1768 family)